MQRCVECVQPVDGAYAEVHVPNVYGGRGAVAVCLGCWPGLRGVFARALLSEKYGVVLRGEWAKALPPN